MFNFSFLFDMEKMTVRDLQCKLYVETLREQYQNRDYMFTSIGEELMERFSSRIEKKLEETKAKESMSDEELQRFIDIPLWEVKSYRECLAQKRSIYEDTNTIFNPCKDRDFCIALLLTYWKATYAKTNSADLKEVESILLRELVLDLDKIDSKVVLDTYSPYLIHNSSLKFPGKEVKSLISEYSHFQRHSVLEIGSDFYFHSDKIIRDPYTFLLAKVIRDINESKSVVARWENDLFLSPQTKYSTIVADVSYCSCSTADEMIDYYNQLVGHTNSDGYIIFLDAKGLIASAEMMDFRKKIIDENLLEMYIDGSAVFEDTVYTYILHTSSQAEGVDFHFVSEGSMGQLAHEHILNQHRRLSKIDIQSLNYNFGCVSELLSGHEGKAYWVNDLFSIPQTGVGSMNISGLFPVFQMKDMPHGIADAVKSSADLEECEISGSYRIITENKLVLFIGEEKIHSCYIEASTDKPVYIGHQFMILDLNTDVVRPEYMQILAATDILEKIVDENGRKRDDFHRTDYDYDPEYGESLITPERKFLAIHSMIQIPSKEKQEKAIIDAQFIYASAVDRERAFEMLLAEKTWLNEEHIRNIKHRIGNELVPVQNDIDSLRKLLVNHPEGITLDTVRGKDEKVSELLSRLLRCISKVTDSLQDLTRTVDKGDLKPVDIVAAVNDYAQNISLNGFKLGLKLPNERISVNGSVNMIESILRNIVDNAVRHGFYDKSRDDYAIEISIGNDGNGNCVLSVKNNGLPMSDHARESYFKRGSVAGATGHSGIGGADVKDTANVMGGEVTLPIDEEGWPVCIRISLPIINSEKI